jgi:uncharacterized protein (TIGR00730 family)
MVELGMLKANEMNISRVAVFGGSRPKPGDPTYEEALQLGQLLGQAGYTVLTGGYIGTMEAVSRGAAEAGVHVVGVTCDEIENFRPGSMNPWAKEEVRLSTLSERIFALIEGSDACLALPGGPGTLTEIAVTWNHLVIQAIPPRPLILIGPGWRETFDTFFRVMDRYIPAPQRRWLLFAEDAASAVQLLSQF